MKLRWEISLTALVTLVGGVLRFHHLGAQSLWMDEGATVAIVKLPWREFVDLLTRRELNMGAYYLLLKVLPSALLETEARLRFLSALFGTLTIPALWIYARKLLDSRAALLCAALAAVNGFLIAYSQEARGYAMAVFFLVVTCAVGFEAMRGRFTVVWIVLCWTTFYSHFYSGLWLLPMAWVVLKASGAKAPEYLEQRTPRLKAGVYLKPGVYLNPGAYLKARVYGKAWFNRNAGVKLVAVAGAVPLLVFAARTRGGQLDWVPRLSLAGVINSWYELAGFSILGAVILFSAAVFIAARALLRRDRDSGLHMTAAQFILPLLLLFALSALHPAWVPRFLIFSIPFLLLLASRAVQSLPNFFAAPLGVVLLLALASHATHGMVKQDWRSLTASLCKQQDALVFWPGMARMPFEYYRVAYPACGIVLFPASGERITPREFQADKKQLATQVCASNQHELTLVFDTAGQSQRKFDDVLGLVGRCYIELRSSKSGSLEVSLWERRYIGVSNAGRENARLLRSARNDNSKRELLASDAAGSR